MTKSRLAAIWDSSRGGWYFRAERHEGVPHYCVVLDICNPHANDWVLKRAARLYAAYCGVDSTGDVEIVRP